MNNNEYVKERCAIKLEASSFILKNTKVVILFYVSCFISCAGCAYQSQDNFSIGFQKVLEGDSIITRFPVPHGFERLRFAENGFESYLRNLPLKPEGSPILAFNGSVLEKDGVYAAVVDLPIGNKDLHQCADALIRLRAEYLWRQGRFDEIHFHFTNGFDVAYSKWMQGYRVVIEGNETYWTTEPKSPSNTYKDFWNYMETIFMYAGTISLSKELKPVDVKDMKIGDIFIQGGSPGHAVIVVDMAVNPENQERVFMLAQSYMPAQNLQVLLNPLTNDVWYNTNQMYPLKTPEWTFYSGSLKRFN
jgi:hypothetical protein